jgi:tripartite-type tricarboxylate transporter receptor subunit TctC
MKFGFLPQLTASHFYVPRRTQNSWYYPTGQFFSKLICPTRRRILSSGLARAREKSMLVTRRKSLQVAVSALAMPMISRASWAQAYPTKQIKLVVPFPPAGAFDSVARPWSEKMKSLLGTVVIENVGGAGASLGSASVARAQADGYTLLCAGTLTHINEALIKSHPLYDAVKDIVPISNVANVVFGFVVHPSIPAKDLKELAVYAKNNADKLQFAHNGVGTVNHLNYEVYKLLAGLPDIVYVPYRGAGQVLVDLIAGQVTMSVVGVTGQTLEMHRTGKIRMLALTNPTRLVGAPEVPTVAEQGFPGLTNAMSIGIAAPAKTPIAILEKIAQATRTALTDSAYQKWLVDSGFEVASDTTPEKFRQSLAKDIAYWKPIIDKLGIKID